MMNIINRLSSQTGDRTQAANRKVVMECLAKPVLLVEISGGLGSKDAALVGDCAEVLTQVAEQQPRIVAPYAMALAHLITHKATRVRWEAMHALALVAPITPRAIMSLLPQLGEILRKDTSIIVRDYAVEALGNFATTGSSSAKAALPLLKETLTLWDGKHAGRALTGLANAVRTIPQLREEARSIGHQYAGHDKGVVRKAAQKLIQVAEFKKPARGL